MAEEYTMVRISKGVAEKLRKVAEADMRSMANMVEWLILERFNNLPQKTQPGSDQSMGTLISIIEEEVIDG